MSGQLIVQDFAGAHNADLGKTRARLIKGGSWKKQRVIVIIPAADLIPAKVCLALWNLGFPPNNGVVRIMALGCEVGIAYSTAIEQILAHPELKDWEYIYTTEHDNLPPPDAVIKLIEALDQHPELSAISGTYFCKGPNGPCQRWGDVSDPLPNFRPQPPPKDNEIGECVGLGMGACLFRLSMFKDTRLTRPWFRTLSGKDGFATQDLVFWGDARKYGYRAAVHGGVRVGHYDFDGKFGPPDFVW